MNLPNQITLLRIFLVPVIIALLLYADMEKMFFYWTAVGLFIFACMTDAIDGYIAKRFEQKSIFGSFIDPIADKFLLLGVFLSLSLMSHLPAGAHIPAWVTIAVISRDLVILMGSAIIYVLRGSLVPLPLFVGKLTTVIQMSTLVACLLLAPSVIKNVFFAATFLMTILSGIFYVRMGSRLIQT